jgi:hypothetical protein
MPDAHHSRIHSVQLIVEARNLINVCAPLCVEPILKDLYNAMQAQNFILGLFHYRRSPHLT